MFPSLLHFGRTLAQRQLGWAHTHPPAPSPSPPRFLTGELSSCNPITTRHCRGNPAGGPPSKCLPALARSRPGHGADTQEPGWVPGSPALRRGATSAPADAHAPYILGAHSGAHPCARAPPHSGVRTPLSGQGLPCRRRPGVVRGAQPGLPPGLRRPPRPAPPLEPAEPSAPGAAKFCLQSAVGSAWLRIAVTAGLTVRPAVRPALPRAPRGSRHPEPPPACAVSVPSCCRVCSQPPVRPRSPFSSSPAALAPSPPPPVMARGPARTSLGPRSQQLPLLSLLLLLLLRDADGSHTAAARPAPPAAADGLAGDKNPQRSPGDVAAAQSPGAQDMVAVHMLRLYEKYSRRGARPGGGNTVRSFRARLGK